MKLAEIATNLNCELDGDGELEISGIAPIDQAKSGELTFLTNRKYHKSLKTTKASAIIVSQNFDSLAISTLRSKNPYLTFARAIDLFHTQPKSSPGIHPTALISKHSRIGENASIGPYVIIDENVAVGDNSIIHPHVVICRGSVIGDNFIAYSHVSVREESIIGNDVILQNGVVIGSDGYGFAKQDDGSYAKITQSGRVVIEDDVEVQANTTIDRAAIGETRILKGTKIDNLVQVGHGSKVGYDSLLCSQVGLAGSTEIGNNVILTGQVGVAGHCRIGDRVIATAQSGIPSDIEPDSIVSGYPAIENRSWLKSSALFSKLPEISKSLKELQRRVDKYLK